jgi:hypothetical protein
MLYFNRYKKEIYELVKKRSEDVEDTNEVIYHFFMVLFNFVILIELFYVAVIISEDDS